MIMKDNLLQESDILISNETGKEYKVWWVSEWRVSARSYLESGARRYHDIAFVRDISKGIKTWPKSEQTYTLKTTES